MVEVIDAVIKGHRWNGSRAEQSVICLLQRWTLPTFEVSAFSPFERWSLAAAYQTLPEHKAALCVDGLLTRRWCLSWDLTLRLHSQISAHAGEEEKKRKEKSYPLAFIPTDQVQHKGILKLYSGVLYSFSGLDLTPLVVCDSRNPSPKQWLQMDVKI